jgi:hypothetical protein
MGRSPTASGDGSTAIGWQTTAPSFAETAIGSYNTFYTPANTFWWDASDRLFVIGNGTPGANSDALVMLKNGNTTISGTVTAPGFKTPTGTSSEYLMADGSVSIRIPWDPITPPTLINTYKLNSYYPELGGYVIEVNNDGTHGLVVAPQEQGTSNWFEANDLMSDAANHNSDGAQFKDWRLPTRRECSLISSARGAVGLISSGQYWSATQSGINTAWGWDVNSGSSLQLAKDNVASVLTVRAF